MRRIVDEMQPGGPHEYLSLKPINGGIPVLRTHSRNAQAKCIMWNKPVAKSSMFKKGNEIV